MQATCAHVGDMSKMVQRLMASHPSCRMPGQRAREVSVHDQNAEPLALSRTWPGVREGMGRLTRSSRLTGVHDSGYSVILGAPVISNSRDGIEM
jgi:hypothetical protein